LNYSISEDTTPHDVTIDSDDEEEDEDEQDVDHYADDTSYRGKTKRNESVCRFIQSLDGFNIQ